jgi:hypothetical protein
VGRPLWREDGSVFCICCWPLPAQSCDHILLSQIWDFPFRRLLRLTGSRWRYSTPPPHGDDSNDLLCFFCNPSSRTTQKTHPLYSSEGMFTAPLHRNGSYSIVACVIVAAGMYLPSSCLAIDFSSDFTIPAFGHHVPLYWHCIVNVIIYVLNVKKLINNAVPGFQSENYLKASFNGYASRLFAHSLSFLSLVACHKCE